MLKDRTGRASLAAGGAAALLASACCLGPLVLVTLGVSGAWIGHLVALEPYRPIFIAVAVAAMALAWRRIFRPLGKCSPGEVCATTPVRRLYKVLFWLTATLVVIGALFPYLMILWFY